MPKKITKLVIPAAGYGTRFLPWTKTMPKEMLPIVNRPVADLIVQEAVEAGIETVIFITSVNKKPLEDYFGRNLELEAQLKKAGKEKERAEIIQLTKQARFIFIRQGEALGNGHAILQAKEAVGNQPFAVVWGDELWANDQPRRLTQVISGWQKYPDKNMITLIQSNPQNHADWCTRYGNVQAKKISPGIYQIEKMIEKPDTPAQSLSDLFSVSGFVFQPGYFRTLEKTRPGKGNEIWWNDGLEPLIKTQQVYGIIIKGDYLDIGQPEGFLKANLMAAHLKNQN